MILASGMCLSLNELDVGWSQKLADVLLAVNISEFIVANFSLAVFGWTYDTNSIDCWWSAAVNSELA